MLYKSLAHQHTSQEQADLQAVQADNWVLVEVGVPVVGWAQWEQPGVGASHF